MHLFRRWLYSFLRVLYCSWPQGLLRFFIQAAALTERLLPPAQTDLLQTNKAGGDQMAASLKRARASWPCHTCTCVHVQHVLRVRSVRSSVRNSLCGLAAATNCERRAWAGELRRVGALIKPCLALRAGVSGLQPGLQLFELFGAAASCVNQRYKEHQS